MEPGMPFVRSRGHVNLGNHGKRASTGRQFGELCPSTPMQPAGAETRRTCSENSQRFRSILLPIIDGRNLTDCIAERRAQVELERLTVACWCRQQLEQA